MHKGSGRVAAAIVGVMMLVGAASAAALGLHAPDRERVIASTTRAQQLPVALADLPGVTDERPEWYQRQLSAEEKARRERRAVTYTIATRGRTGSDIAEFSRQVNETLNDERGWARLGVRFQRVEAGGDFHLILAEARLMPTFSEGCDTEWSCRVGQSVIINDDRWRGATAAWNAAGGGMRDYRHMVVNHEVGHWLGHGHETCTTPGAPAAVMQQQSISLQGCAFNPWPLEHELWSTALGVRR